MKTPEMRLEQFIDLVVHIAQGQGITVALSCSIPSGNANYTRVTAASPHPGELGRELTQNAMEEMHGFYQQQCQRQQGGDAPGSGDPVQNPGPRDAGL